MGEFVIEFYSVSVYNVNMFIGETILHEFLKIIFPTEEILVNYRPEWLNGLEIDFYLPKLFLPIEFQGEQHYEPTFGEETLEKTKLNDTRKKQILLDRGEPLVSIQSGDLSMAGIKSRIRRYLSLRFANNPDVLLSFEREIDIKEFLHLIKWANKYKKSARDKGSCTAIPRSKRYILTEDKQSLIADGSRIFHKPKSRPISKYPSRNYPPYIHRPL